MTKNVLSVLLLINLSFIFWWFIDSYSGETAEQSQAEQSQAKQSQVELRRGSLSQKDTSTAQPQDVLDPSAERIAEADRAWTALSSLDLTPFKGGTSGDQSPHTGLIGAQFSSWRPSAQREGFTVDEGAPIPTLKRQGISIALRVRDGVILGARVTFAGEVGGPDWGQVAIVLAGQGALGGPNDPMMMLDQLMNPAPSLAGESPHKLPRPSALSGAWGEGASRVAYLLELSESGAPSAARLWMSPGPRLGSASPDSATPLGPPGGLSGSTPQPQ